MKRYAALACSSLLGFTSLSYLYYYGENSLEASHRSIVESIARAKQADTELDKDTLRSQNFTLSSYDSLVEKAGELESFCQSSFPKMGDQFLEALTLYCKLVDKKVENIDIFKTKNAIYRNSLFYLQEKANQFHQQIGHQPKSGQKLILLNHIISTSLMYALSPNQDLYEEIAKDLKTAEKQTKASDLESKLIIEHVKKILSNRPFLSSVIEDITSGESVIYVDRMREEFFIALAKEREGSKLKQKILFGLSLLLLLSFTFSILNIWKAAQTLEKKVEERTRDLRASRQLIIEQQQALVASAKLSSLGEMAGGVAHEINTPLAIIQMRTDQMMEIMAEPETDREMLVKCLTSIDLTIKRIGQIVRGLRSFARDGRKDPAVPNSVTAMVNETFALCRERFQNHGVTLEYITTGDGEVTCRSSEICQVLLNMLNNSYDAIQDQPEKWISVETIFEDSHVCFRVTDSGNGIPKDVQEKMMQPFFTTKEVGKGTGLGLSISKGIVEGHSGKLYIDNSCPNTRICFTLPKVGALAASGSAAA